MEKREKWLKENGFKKRWIDDKSGYWFEKHFKLGEFKCRFNSEEDFNFIEIEFISSKKVLFNSESNEYFLFCFNIV